MSEDPGLKSTKRVPLLVLSVFILFLVTTGVTCWVFFVFRHDKSELQPVAAGPPSFATLRDSDIPGRYRMTEGEVVSYLVLYDDHTFMNKDGTVFRQYRWEITPGDLSLTFQSGRMVFGNLEAPGVYTGMKASGKPLRLEKLPAYEPAERTLPPAVA